MALPPIVTFIIRWSLAFFFNVNLALLVTMDMVSLYKNGQEWKFFIYFTNWALILVNVRLFVEALAFTFEVEATWDRFLRVSRNLSQAPSMITCLAFWVLLYGDGSKYANRWYLNHYEHTLPLVATLIEFGPLASKVRIRDFWQPCLLSIGFLAFSVYFEGQGWTNHRGESSIYPVINWTEKPVVSGALALGIVVAVGCAHLVLGVISGRKSRYDDKKQR